MKRRDEPALDADRAADQAKPRAEPLTDAQREAELDAVLERVAQEIAVRRLAVPAMFLLESTLPLSFIASQALVVLEPIVQSILDLKDYELFQQLMEDREKVRRLIERLEELEDERGRASREARQKPKESD